MNLKRTVAEAFEALADVGPVGWTEEVGRGVAVALDELSAAASWRRCPKEPDPGLYLVAQAEDGGWTHYAATFDGKVWVDAHSGVLLSGSWYQPDWIIGPFTHEPTEAT